MSRSGFRPANPVLSTLSATTVNVETQNIGTIILTNVIAVGALRTITNYAHATSITIDASTDVSASVTNDTSANVSLLITNTVDGASGHLLITSDASARTFSVFSDKNIRMFSTNETLNSTQIVSTASKDMLINWLVKKKTATATNVYVWAKSEP